MDIISISCIALGLAMDCFAVSLVSGLTIKELKITYPLKIAIFFGVFQAVMLLLGWFAGKGAENLISSFDHWIAFGLLVLIGFKMIYEGCKKDTKENFPLNTPLLFILSFTTSIDAFAVGVSFAFLKISPLLPAIVIGIVTFLLSGLGTFIGNRVGHFFENRIKILGGITLIGIGVKILIEHYLK